MHLPFSQINERRISMTRRIVVASVFLLFISTCAVEAQIPRTLSYQGVLSDTLGNPKPDGTYSFTFRLYPSSSGGSAVWEEQKTLQVRRGLFQTHLGEQVPFGSSVPFDRPYWLSIQVASEPELSPRIPLTAVGYSFNAAKADTAQYALNVPTQIAVDSARIAGTVPNNSITSQKIADSTITGADISRTAALSVTSLRTNGDVGIGTDSPSPLYKMTILPGTLGGININPVGDATNQKAIYIQQDHTGSSAYGVYSYVDRASLYPVGGLFTSNSPNSTPGYVAYGLIASARAYASGAANQAYAVAGYFKGTGSQVRPYTATELNLTKSVSLMIDTDYDDTGEPGSHYFGLADLIRARIFKNATPTGADLLWLDGSGRMTIAHGANNTTNPYSRPRLHVAETAATDQFVETATNAPRGIINSQHNDGVQDARFYFRKSRGTLANPTAIQSGDSLGTLWFSGYDGTDYLDMASIAVVSEGTVASSRVPTRMVFSTASDASPSVLAERMRISSNGNVGIGSSSPSEKLHVVGNVLANSYQTPSSVRYKENIQPIERALEKIQKLRGVKYTLKENGKPEIGLIAEEVAQIVPEIVILEPNGRDATSLDYARMVALLIEAIKEQQTQIEHLKQQLTQLAER
jgi:hypothetical protein